MTRSSTDARQWDVKAVGELSMGRASGESYRPLWGFLEQNLKLFAPSPPLPLAAAMINTNNAKSASVPTGGPATKSAKMLTNTVTLKSKVSKPSTSPTQSYGSTTGALGKTRTVETAGCSISECIVVPRKKRRQKAYKAPSHSKSLSSGSQPHLPFATATSTCSEQVSGVEASSRLPSLLRCMDRFFRRSVMSQLYQKITAPEAA